MKNKVDYSLYKCPYDHIDKECGHELKGPEGYADGYGVWCACGFRGPVFCLEPEDLKLKKINSCTSIGMIVKKPLGCGGSLPPIPYIN